MYGIERIRIQSTWDDKYIRINRACEPTADALYPRIFADIGMPLLNERVTSIECTKEDAVSRYDWKEGIDVILHFIGGTKATMQEKYLTYPKSTVTFETEKSSGAPGAWFYCTAQYYFVAYARRLRQRDFSFQDWILIDLPGLHRIDATTELRWHSNRNTQMNRRAKFQYLYFDDVPDSCIIARHQQPAPSISQQLYWDAILQAGPPPRT